MGTSKNVWDKLGVYSNYTDDFIFYSKYLHNPRTQLVYISFKPESMTKFFFHVQVWELKYALIYLNC